MSNRRVKHRKALRVVLMLKAESVEFLSKLRQLCLAFDEHHGNFPEHEFEGYSVYRFALEADGGPVEHQDEWTEELERRKAGHG
jgi:hypothetical protein